MHAPATMASPRACMPRRWPAIRAARTGSTGRPLAGSGAVRWETWWRKRRLPRSVWFYRAVMAAGPLAFVALIAGWITTEVGRQPWVVYGAMRTAEAASPLGASAVATSLVAFVVVYFAVFGAGVVYLLRLMARPPEASEKGPEAEPGPIRTAGITPAPQVDGHRPAAAR